MPKKPKPDLRSQLLNIALKQIGSKGWVELSLREVAEEAHVTLAEVHAVYPTKMHIFSEFVHMIDQQALANVEKFDEEETVKDRLFAVVMARFDALIDYKPVIASLRRDAIRDPMLVLYSLPCGLNSMMWMLEAAGLDASGISGIIRAKLLGASYLYMVGVWLKDDSSDMASTMAALDSCLERLNKFPGFL